MKIKIKSCQNGLWWYSGYIGQEFDVRRIEEDWYWVLEPDPDFRLLNWVRKEDAELIYNDPQ